MNQIFSLLIEFIPIFIIFMYFVYPSELKDFSNTFLGKACALFIIILYTLINKLYGLLVCGIIILFYQTNHIEGLYESPSYKQDFVKQYCKNGKLNYKNIDINVEMTEHVFPEIKFNGKTCNPCDDACDYDIIEEKLKIEEKMQPKQSNDWFDTIVKSMN